MSVPNLKTLVEQHDGCSLPWVHVDMNLQLDQVSACCKYKGSLGNISKSSVAEVWKNTAYQNLRNDILNQKYHSNCSRCDNLALSYKNFKNKSYKEIQVNIENPKLPQHCVITLKNTCDLACRMCYPDFSSKFLSVIKNSNLLLSYFTISSINNKFKISQLENSFTDIRTLTIAGGEPLIDQDCFDIICLVKKESQYLKEIAISTNLNNPNFELIDLLSSTNVGIINLNVSLDGPKNIHEYIRYGSSWAKTMYNIELIRKKYANRFRIGVNTTISALNVGYIDEFLNEITALKFDSFRSSTVMQNYLHSSVLPDDIKDVYKEKIKKIDITKHQIPGLGQDYLDTALYTLNDDIGKVDLFLKFIKEFDRVARTSFYEIYSEFKNL